jgi:hypothetical protein
LGRGVDIKAGDREANVFEAAEEVLDDVAPGVLPTPQFTLTTW